MRGTCVALSKKARLRDRTSVSLQMGSSRLIHLRVQELILAACRRRLSVLPVNRDLVPGEILGVFGPFPFRRATFSDIMGPKKPPLQADPAAVAKGLKDGYDWFEADGFANFAHPPNSESNALDLPASNTITHIPISKAAIDEDEDEDEEVDLVILNDKEGEFEDVDVDVIRIKEGEFVDVDVIGVKDISAFDFKAKIKALNHDAVQWLNQAETTEEGRQLAKKAYPTVCRLMANHAAFDINEGKLI